MTANQLLLVVLLTTGAGASPALAQRHIKGSAAWGAHLGRSQQGNTYELSYTPLLTNHLGLRLGGLLETGSLGRQGNYAAYQGRVFLAPQLFRLGELVYVHLLIGAAGQFERTNLHGTGAEPPVGSRPQRFTYGPQAGAEIDGYLSNRISLVATGTKGYLLNTPLIDEWPGYLSVGLRYHFL